MDALHGHLNSQMLAGKWKPQYKQRIICLSSISYIDRTSVESIKVEFLKRWVERLSYAVDIMA